MLFILFFICYQVLQIIALPIVCFYLTWRGYKGKKIFGNFTHRMGFIPTSNNGSIWIHGVSVGETLAAEYFCNDLTASGKSVYLTSGTPGAVHVSKHFHVAQRSFLPFDFLPCMLLAFWRIKPTALIIIEGDWWPNLVMLAKIFRIPVYGLNARVTNHTGLRSVLFKIIGYGVVRNVSRLFVQTATDAQAFANNGVAQKKIQVLGNIKAYNVVAKLTALNLHKHLTATPVFMAGSIHPGEIEVFLTCFGELKKQFPRLKCIIVPRHLHWLEDLTKRANQYGNVFVLRNKPDATFAQTLVDHDIIIGGALGIMFELYAYASLFLLGGTFVTVGGHNLLEPAVWGIASIVGPHHANCLDTLQHLQQYDAGFVAHDDTELLKISHKLLSSPDQLATAGAAAARWLEQDAKICGQALHEFAAKLQ
jgi:3-deoxy-D-manno-octulosonic-acid transferase